MKNWFDREEYYCKKCGNKWIIESTKSITDKEHKDWIKESIQHHNEICKGEKHD